jgi:hypothetical protein
VSRSFSLVSRTAIALENLTLVQLLAFARNARCSENRAAFSFDEAQAWTAIPFPLFQHDRPAESGLRRFEHQELKTLAVITDGNTPFAIVIGEHKRIAQADPGTSFRTHKTNSRRRFSNKEFDLRI